MTYMGGMLEMYLGGLEFTEHTQCPKLSPQHCLTTLIYIHVLFMCVYT